jgi:hypothetical protein
MSSWRLKFLRWQQISVEPQYGSCCMSLFWRLEFCGSSQIFVKCVDPRSLGISEVQRVSSARGRRGVRVAFVSRKVKFPGFQRFLYDLYFYCARILSNFSGTNIPVICYNQRRSFPYARPGGIWEKGGATPLILNLGARWS